MPTTYAHWHFGDECIALMPKKLQTICNEHRDLYDIGVHGPDILFYDLTHANVSEYGYDTHAISAKFFFEKTKSVYEKYKQKDEMLAYVLGFLSHFTLDSVCHGYVERKREVSNISHNKVEAEWDKHLIEKDGRKLNLVDRSESLNPTRENTKIISYFFPFDYDDIYRVCLRQKQFVHLTWCMNERKYRFLKGLLMQLKKYDYADLLIDFAECEVCADSNVRLDKLKEKALEIYPLVLNSYMSYLTGKKKKLDRYFHNNFNYPKDYKDIKVLPLKKELKYKVI